MKKWMPFAGGAFIIVAAALAVYWPRPAAGPRPETVAMAGPASAASEADPFLPAPDEALGYTRGRADAPVHVVEFSDFGCPYCATFALNTYPVLHEEFVKTGKVRWTFMPFVMGMFPNGSEAAMAAECAGEQGEEHFWRMHDELFAAQKIWKSSRAADDLMATYAAALQLDRTRFRNCYESGSRAMRIAGGNAAADRAGVRATPSFLINGRLVEGALPVEHFRMVLDELSRARR